VAIKNNECSFETSKSEGFADDNTTNTLLELASLSRVKIVLEDLPPSVDLNAIWKKQD
jgi:hypothetical protein